MTAALNHFGSELINKYQSRAGKDVFNAIKTASKTTGVDFGYLLEQAQAESNFDAGVKAKTSSATGLYQFIDQTWLETVAKHGYKHGLGKYGQEITFNPKTGRATVSDPAMRREILELRKDPQIASNMAAEFAKDNKEYLEKATNAKIGKTEMYLAHFLGAGGAAKFINSMNENAGQQGTKIFPAAANANKPVFYNKNGAPRSLDQIYAFFDKKFSNVPTGAVPKDTPAATTPSYTPDSGTYLVQLMQEQMAEDLMDDVQKTKAYNAKYDSDERDDTMQLAASGVSSMGGNGGFASRGGLYKTVSQIDVMMMSKMIRQWTQEDNVRAHDLYRTTGRFA